MSRPVLAVALVVLTQGTAHAEEESDFIALGTDRPGNGNAATTVPQLALQIETSSAYLKSASSGADTNQFTFPTMVRFGILSSWEVRVGSSLIGLDASPGTEAGSPTDTSLGTKVQLLAQLGPVPDLALMVDVFLPTGEDAFTASVVVPEARAAASWGLPFGFALLLNAGVDVPEEAQSRFARFIHVVNVGYTFPFWQERLSLFVESYGRTPISGDGQGFAQLDLGTALMIGRRTQLDLFSQHKLSGATADLQVALGLSTRF